MKQVLLAALCLWSLSLSGQTFSASGQLGWVFPSGSGINEDNYDVSGGISFGGDLMYHLGDEAKLGVGLGYYSGILASSIFDAYGLQVFGVKGLYELKPKGFTPFVGLTLGASSLTTPMITINGVVTTQALTATRLGLVPQVGIKIGGLYLAADYIVPANFDIEENMTTGGVGGLLISLGYRLKVDISDL